MSNWKSLNCSVEISADDLRKSPEERKRALENLLIQKYKDFTDNTVIAFEKYCKEIRRNAT